MTNRAHASTVTRARTSATGRERVPALDGIRALGVLLIMGFHFGVRHMSGGFVGVDVFYVLSGYLITGLLLGEWAGRPASGSGPSGCAGPGGCCPPWWYCWWW